MNDYADIIEDIDQYGEGLTSWETEFIASVQERIDEYRELTSKQEGILDQIYEDRVSEELRSW